MQDAYSRGASIGGQMGRESGGRGKWEDEMGGWEPLKVEPKIFKLFFLRTSSTARYNVISDTYYVCCRS